MGGDEACSNRRCPATESTAAPVCDSSCRRCHNPPLPWVMAVSSLVETIGSPSVTFLTPDERRRCCHVVKPATILLGSVSSPPGSTTAPRPDEAVRPSRSMSASWSSSWPRKSFAGATRKSGTPCALDSALIAVVRRSRTSWPGLASNRRQNGRRLARGGSS